MRFREILGIYAERLLGTPELVYFNKRVTVKPWENWYVAQVDVFCPLGVAKSLEIIWRHVDDRFREFSEVWKTETWFEETSDLEGTVWMCTWAIWKIAVVRVNPCEVGDLRISRSCK